VSSKRSAINLDNIPFVKLEDHIVYTIDVEEYYKIAEKTGLENDTIKKVNSFNNAMIDACIVKAVVGNNSEVCSVVDPISELEYRVVAIEDPIAGFTFRASFDKVSEKLHIRKSVSFSDVYQEAITSAETSYPIREYKEHLSEKLEEIVSTLAHNEKVCKTMISLMHNNVPSTN